MNVCYIVAAFAASGCAFGNRIAYHSTLELEMPPSPRPVHVVVVDDRPYVIDGSQAPDWVGIQRSLLGVPYAVRTESGNSLSGDFARCIGESLRAAGADAEYRTLPPGASAESVAADVAEHRVRSSLVFRLREWKTESWISTTLSYDISAESFGPGGTVIGSEWEHGVDALRETEPRQSSLRTAVSDIVRKLLAQPSLRAALIDPSLATPHR